MPFLPPNQQRQSTEGLGYTQCRIWPMTSHLGQVSLLSSAGLKSVTQGSTVVRLPASASHSRNDGSHLNGSRAYFIFKLTPHKVIIPFMLTVWCQYLPYRFEQITKIKQYLKDKIFIETVTDAYLVDPLNSSPRVRNLMSVQQMWTEDSQSDEEVDALLQQQTLKFIITIILY